LIEVEMPSFLPRGSNVWQGGERGTIAIPKGRPAPFDAFKVTAAESLWKWWHSFGAVDSQNEPHAEIGRKNRMADTERPSPFTIPEPTFKFASGPPSEQPPLRSMTVAGLIHNLTIFADFYERASIEINRAEPVLKPSHIGNRDANADVMQRNFRATLAINRVRAYVLAKYGADLTIGSARQLLGDLVRTCRLTVDVAEGLALEAAMDRLDAERGHVGDGPAKTAPKPDLVLVTVNQHETIAVHDAFREATGADALPVSLENRLYHNLGTLGDTTVYHAFSEMGSGGPGGMQQTVDKAIRALEPGAVIGIGIAFGIRETDQSIGEILLSKQLRLYDLQRAGAEILLRGDKPHASSRLINHFEGFSHIKWKGAKVRPGVILSGEKLIDNIDYRDQLLKLEIEAVGGEMEGAGLYASCHDHNVDWIVIKAICDWADGDKKNDKTERQKKAAKNAAEFLVECLKYAPIKRV
jgi:nucleoside phosphorylase